MQYHTYATEENDDFAAKISRWLASDPRPTTYKEARAEISKMGSVDERHISIYISGPFYSGDYQIQIFADYRRLTCRRHEGGMYRGYEISADTFEHFKALQQVVAENMRHIADEAESAKKERK